MSTANFTGLATFLDINVLVHSFAATGPVGSAAEFLNHSNHGHVSAMDVAQSVAAGTPVVTSSYSLDTLYRALVNPSTDEQTGQPSFAAFSEDDALRTMTAVQNLALASGAVVTTEATRKGYEAAVKLVPAHLQGKNKGQVDFEDLMVLGACIAAHDMLVALGCDKADSHVVLVTADKGLLEAGKSLAFHGVAVISTAAYARACAA